MPNGPTAEPPSPIGGYQQVVASGQAGGSVTLASSSGGQGGGGGGEPLNRILNALSNRGLLSQQNGKFYYVGGEKGGGGGGGGASNNSAASSAAATGTTGLALKGMDQISVKTPNRKCRLFLKIDQERDLAAGVCGPLPSYVLFGVLKQFCRFGIWSNTSVLLLYMLSTHKVYKRD